MGARVCFVILCVGLLGVCFGVSWVVFSFAVFFFVWFWILCLSFVVFFLGFWVWFVFWFFFFGCLLVSLGWCGWVWF